MRAYCYPDGAGVIHLTTGDVPDEALCFAASENESALRAAIAAAAESGPGRQVFVVPGLVETDDRAEKVRLLISFRSIIQRCMKEAGHAS